jgi:hypothetical protein
LEQQSTIHPKSQEESMNRIAALLALGIFLSTVSLAMAKDYQVTGPVVDVKDDVIIVKKGTENWEVDRDKNTKTTGEIKKGDRVMVKYKMTATSIENKTAPTKTDAKAKTDTKAKAETKTEMKTEAKTK